MDFSRTFYRKNSTKNKLILSQNIFHNNFIRDNKSAKKLFYNTHNNINYKSLSSSPTNNSSNNCVTKNTLKSINKLISEKLEKSKNVKNKLKYFYKDEIKYKIRKSTKYKSLFEKTEISNSNYENIKTDLDEKIFNIKLRTRPKKINYYINTPNNTNNNININLLNYNSNISTKKELNKSGISYEIIKNNSKNKNINFNNNIDNINKEHYICTFYSKKDLKNKNINNIKEKIKEKNNNINIKNSKIISKEINNKIHPPYAIDFRDKNLIGFYSQTKDICYKKYFLFLQKNKLEVAKMKSDLINSLGDLDINKYMKFYQLFKPYNTNFERYVIFLKEKTYYEAKQKDKLKLIENELLDDIVILNKTLMNMHKTLKSYLSDKFFLLCVKNSTLDLEKFSKEYKTEFKIDLKNLETLKNYIKEISELNSEENILAKNKGSFNIKIKNNSNDKNNSFISKIHKIRENFELSFNHDVTGHKIFETEEEFLEGVNSSRQRIELLLKKGNLVEIELANLRDYISHNAVQIEKMQNNIIKRENIYNLFQQNIINVKKKNKLLLDYKKKIMKFKKYNISNKIVRKIKYIINNILETGDKSLKQFFTKKRKLKENPNIMLKDLENLIIFLINFKQEQKLHNYIEYSKVIKNMEKNKRIAVIEQRKEEFEKNAEKKMKEIIEKNMKVLLIKDKRTNVSYKPIKKNMNNITINDDDEKNEELFY